MNKMLLTSTLGFAMLLTAGLASANPYLNGSQLNGLSAAGQSTDDFRLNGTQLNGLSAADESTDDWKLNGTQINGMPAQVSQDIRFAGLSAGPVVHAIQSSASPNLSALPISRMTVRLAPAI